MTEQEQKEFHIKLGRLPPAFAKQWTQDVYEAHLRLRKARADWKKANGRPTDVLGLVKDDGMPTPLFIPNEPYLRYQELQKVWMREYEPAYIKDNRARMSRGDFEGEDDWNVTDSTS
jgi:hypothetical protein